MSREKILKAIARNKPAKAPLPDVPAFPPLEKDLVKAFALVSESSGTNVLVEREAPLPALLDRLFPEVELLYSKVSGLESRGLPAEIKDPVRLRDVQLAVLPGRIGVAENGAVWLTDKEMGPRVSPFITQHLMLILPSDALVWNMHEAYEKIDIDETGFGVFIAGPSKTADIEQSLVIGAQAARSLTVVIR